MRSKVRGFYGNYASSFWYAISWATENELGCSSTPELQILRTKLWRSVEFNRRPGVIDCILGRAHHAGYHSEGTVDRHLPRTYVFHLLLITSFSPTSEKWKNSVKSPFLISSPSGFHRLQMRMCPRKAEECGLGMVSNNRAWTKTKEHEFEPWIYLPPLSSKVALRFGFLNEQHLLVCLLCLLITTKHFQTSNQDSYSLRTSWV
jgi:hypothetical protein